MMCIYKIVNTVNGKVYVGSANDFKSRKALHLHMLRGNQHHSVHLQRAWNKHGESVFKFEVVEEVDAQSDLIPSEQAWLDVLQPFGEYGYNIATVAGSTVGLKRTAEQIEQMAARFRGKTLSQDHRDKIREAGLGRKHSVEALQRMRVSAHRRCLKSGRSKSLMRRPGIKKGLPVIQIYPDCSIVTWEASSEAALALGLKGSDSIRRACNDKNRRAAGCAWRYAESS